MKKKTGAKPKTKTKPNLKNFHPELVCPVT